MDTVEEATEEAVDMTIIMEVDIIHKIQNFQYFFTYLE